MFFNAIQFSLENIGKEISDRTSADTLLDNKFTGLINTESTARANEDYAELKGMVNAEAEARANADTNLF
jgi:hypothetical protein